MPKWLRITAWSLGGLLGLVLLGIVTLVVIGNSGQGRRLIESETAKLTSGHVRITGFGGSFPADIEIASLELSDPKGVWMTANGISLHWSPLALLAWDMHVESLSIRAADVVRRPSSSAATSSRRAAPARALPASTSIACRWALSCSSRRRPAWRHASISKGICITGP